MRSDPCTVSFVLEFFIHPIVIALTNSYHISSIPTTFGRTNGGATDGTPSANAMDPPPASTGPGNGGIVEEVEATGARRTSSNNSYSYSNSTHALAQGRTLARARDQASAHSNAQNGQQADHQDQDHHIQDEQVYDDYLLDGLGDDDEDDDADANNLNPDPNNPNVDQYLAIPPTVTQSDDEDDDGADHIPQEGRSNRATEEDEYDDNDVDKEGAEKDDDVGEDGEEKKTETNGVVFYEDVLDDEDEEEDDHPAGVTDPAGVPPTIEPESEVEAEAGAGALVLQEEGGNSNIDALVGAATAAATTTTGPGGVLHNTGVRAILTMAQAQEGG